MSSRRCHKSDVIHGVLSTACHIRLFITSVPPLHDFCTIICNEVAHAMWPWSAMQMNEFPGHPPRYV